VLFPLQRFASSTSQIASSGGVCSRSAFGNSGLWFALRPDRSPIVCVASLMRSGIIGMSFGSHPTMYNRVFFSRRDAPTSADVSGASILQKRRARLPVPAVRLLAIASSGSGAPARRRMFELVQPPKEPGLFRRGAALPIFAVAPMPGMAGAQPQGSRPASSARRDLCPTRRSQTALCSCCLRGRKARQPSLLS